jgi:hypothetical protein
MPILAQFHLERQVADAATAHRTQRVSGSHMVPDPGPDPDIGALQTCQKAIISIPVFNDQEQAAVRSGECRHHSPPDAVSHVMPLLAPPLPHDFSKLATICPLLENTVGEFRPEAEGALGAVLACSRPRSSRTLSTANATPAAHRFCIRRMEGSRRTPQPRWWARFLHASRFTLSMPAARCAGAQACP